MTSRNDSFQTWLAGFKPTDRPMTHYDLLGLELYEADRQKIREMVQRQIRAVWRYTNGPNAHQARQLRTRIDQAARCLLNARLKADYDQRLRSELGHVEPPASDTGPMVHPTSDVVVERFARAERESNRLLIFGSIGVFAVIVLALLLAFRPTGSEPAPGKSALDAAPTTVPPPKSNPQQAPAKSPTPKSPTPKPPVQQQPTSK